MKINAIPEAFSSPLRLAIISSLINRQMFFTELKDATGATDGNLSVQLKKLGQWGYTESKKVLFSGKLLTLYRLTDDGMNEFETYVQLLERILEQKNNS